jgi:excisionase family DNA binding protein
MASDGAKSTSSCSFSEEGPPLRVPDVAQALSVSVRAVYQAVERGELNCIRLGRAVRIPRSELARVLRGESRDTPTPRTVKEVAGRGV